MILISAKRFLLDGKNDGKERYTVVIVSKETPTKLTLSGADIEGMNDDDIIAPGSIIITPDMNYIAFEDGVFMEKE